MLDAFQIMITGVWGILSVNIPVSEDISFTLWQYFGFIALAVLMIKKLFNRGVEQ